MTSVKLTNEMRAVIAKKAIAATFDPQDMALADAEHVLACEGYQAVYAEDVRAKAADLPAHWLRRDQCINYTVKGMRITLCTKDSHFPVPYETRSGSRGYHCHGSHGELTGDLGQKVFEHATAKENLKAKRKEAMIKLLAMLGSVSTFGKLETVWPEGRQFYEAFLAQRVPLPPAVRTDEINAILGLGAAQ